MLAIAIAAVCMFCAVLWNSRLALAASLALLLFNAVEVKDFGGGMIFFISSDMGVWLMGQGFWPWEFFKMLPGVLLLTSCAAVGLYVQEVAMPFIRNFGWRYLSWSGHR